METKTQKIVTASLFCAITLIATIIIKIPSPLKGYINLGDCVVLLSGWMLSPVYGFLSAALGSALADVLSGYITYAPATFVIKGIMAVTAYFGFTLFYKKTGALFSRILSGIIAEIIMVLGYFVFEGFLYGFVPSAVNIPANAVQGVAGIIIASVIIAKIKK